MSEKITFKEYEENILNLPQIWKRELTLPYLTLSLVGEAGEVAEKVKKSIRVNSNGLSASDMAYELGDVLWAVTQLAASFGYSLEEIAAMNLDKLTDRAERNMLEGSGDKR